MKKDVYIVITRDKDFDEYNAFVPQIPGVEIRSISILAAIANVKEKIEYYKRVMKNNNSTIPINDMTLDDIKNEYDVENSHIEKIVVDTEINTF